MKKTVILTLSLLMIGFASFATSSSVNLETAQGVYSSTQTVEKMSLKDRLISKKVMKQLKKEKKANEADFSKGVYILLAIVGLGWLAMGLLDGFEGNNWLIGLLLYCLGGLPGLIYTLIKMKEYYK